MCTAMNIFEERVKKAGYDEGYKIGYEIGYKEGLCEGANELRKTVIPNMLDLGMNVEEIIKLTNLSKEELALYLYH